MTAALRALMTGVIDYAGLFPPAKLPLEEAVREYLEIRESPEAWMLGAFVIPALRVDELEPWANELFRHDGPLRLSLIGRSFDSLDRWADRFPADVDTAREFIRRHRQGIRPVTWEIPFPIDDTGTIRDAIAGAVGGVHSLFTSDAGTDIVFCEVSDGRAGRSEREFLIASLERVPGDTPFGFKLRTGGLTADTIPKVQDVAAVIHTCQKHRCRWKATAGLHHPLRHLDEGVGAKMHGFLNVLFAAVLADAHKLPESVICEILADEDAAGFHVAENGIHWRDYAATVEQIEATRSTTFQSFGSCSFDEPRDDLNELGLL